MQRLVLYLLLFLVTTACSTSGNDAASPEQSLDLEAVRTRIHNANAVYYLRFEKDDSIWFREQYHHNACVMPMDTNMVCGVDAIRKLYYDGGRNKGFKIEIRETSVYGSDSLVVEEGEYDFPDPKGGSYENGKFIAIWKPEGDVWKLYREIWNPNHSPKH